MKNILTVLILLISFNAYSQDESKTRLHLSFKGVPIDGTLNEYVSKMEKSGFNHLGTEDGVAILEGDFAGYKKCTIGVITYGQKDLVSAIAVIFPEKETWSTLSGNYYKLKELLTEKYGKPSESIEEFQTDYQPKDDNSKMHHIKMDTYTYYTTYETANGTIQVSIEHESVIRTYIKLAYFDRINGGVVRDNAIDDL